jgi:Organic solute transporter Ostalpha
MCVKAVVFLTWWQSLAISLLQAVGLIHDISEQWTKDDVGQGLQVNYTALYYSVLLFTILRYPILLCTVLCYIVGCSVMLYAVELYYGSDRTAAMHVMLCTVELYII